jgi:hypothetical protein
MEGKNFVSVAAQKKQINRFSFLSRSCRGLKLLKLKLGNWGVDAESSVAKIIATVALSDSLLQIELEGGKK